MLLEVREARIRYAKAEVVKGISLHVDEREIVALIGPNGAGKTTTLRAISGLKTLASGSINFDGRRIDGSPAHEIVKLGVGHVPEGRVMIAGMSVSDNLRMGAYLRKDRGGISEDMQRMYEHFPILKSRRKQLASSLSGGEQQMLAVARTLMSRPKLILMDEPSMGLAPIMVEEVARMIQEICASGISVLLVEQNANMALGLANRAYVLEVGEICACGNAASLAEDETVKRCYLGG